MRSGSNFVNNDCGPRIKESRWWGAPPVIYTPRQIVTNDDMKGWKINRFSYFQALINTILLHFDTFRVYVTVSQDPSFSSSSSKWPLSKMIWNNILYAFFFPNILATCLVHRLSKHEDSAVCLYKTRHIHYVIPPKCTPTGLPKVDFNVISLSECDLTIFWYLRRREVKSTDEAGGGMLLIRKFYKLTFQS
jgi:hypothetical protein